MYYEYCIPEVDQVYNYISKDNHRFLKEIMESNGFDVCDSFLESIYKACEILKIDLNDLQQFRVYSRLYKDFSIK